MQMPASSLRLPSAVGSAHPVLFACRTLLVTEQCLLHESRNPQLGKEGIEETLKEYLRVGKDHLAMEGSCGR